MPEILHCDRCGGDSPTDARFCIDCGAPIGAATTGPTTRLTGIVCRSCNTNNPEHARFCVVCGRAFGAAMPPPPRPAAPPAAAPAPTRPAARPSYPRMATQPTLLPSRPWPPSHPPTTAHHRQGLGNDPGGVVFLIGLVALLASNSAWPARPRGAWATLARRPDAAVCYRNLLAGHPNSVLHQYGARPRRLATLVLVTQRDKPQSKAPRAFDCGLSRCADGLD